MRIRDRTRSCRQAVALALALCFTCVAMPAASESLTRRDGSRPVSQGAGTDTLAIPSTPESPTGGVLPPLSGGSSDAPSTTVQSKKSGGWAAALLAILTIGLLSSGEDKEPDFDQLDGAVRTWVIVQNQQALDVIETLVRNDGARLQRYLDTEQSSESPFGKLNRRMEMIESVWGACSGGQDLSSDDLNSTAGPSALAGASLDGTMKRWLSKHAARLELLIVARLVPEDSRVVSSAAPVESDGGRAVEYRTAILKTLALRCAAQ